VGRGNAAAGMGGGGAWGGGRVLPGERVEDIHSILPLAPPGQRLRKYLTRARARTHTSHTHTHTHTQAMSLDEKHEIQSLDVPIYLQHILYIL
jgi:hypothetical protein